MRWQRLASGPVDLGSVEGDLLVFEMPKGITGDMAFEFVETGGVDATIGVYGSLRSSTWDGGTYWAQLNTPGADVVPADGYHLLFLENRAPKFIAVRGVGAGATVECTAVWRE